jgi:hypothetical protein
MHTVADTRPMRLTRRLKSISDKDVNEFLIAIGAALLLGVGLATATNIREMRHGQDSMASGVEELAKATAAVKMAVERMDQNTTAIQRYATRVAAIVGVVAGIGGAVLAAALAHWWRL